MLAPLDYAIDVQLKSVLIATDFSAASEKALRHALAIARSSHAKLYLMHVVSSPVLNIAGPEAVAQSTTRSLRDLMLLERGLIADGSLRDMRYQALVYDGDIWSELQRVIGRERIDMAVVGTHGRGGFKKLMLGSVAEQIFRNSRCPVLTVGRCSPPEPQMLPSGAPQPLLFPTDFSEASLRALPYAILFAEKRSTKLVLLHMLSLAPLVEDGLWYTPAAVEEMKNEARATARRHLRDWVARFNFKIEPTFVAEFGEPAEGILEVVSAIHAEAIVMGLPHTAHVKVKSHLPRSTAYDVVCGAICPVLTVRADAGLAS
jgi:nucleotide-binding universal stress UspA family protein